MNYNNAIHISTRVSYWLRHNPQEAKLIMDEKGWVLITDILLALDNLGFQISNKELIDLNNSFEKKRWEFNPTSIRAKYGHSVSVIHKSFEIEPPETLYHGTSIENITKIIASGLLPMNRNNVHLSDDFESAEKIGKRHGYPIVIELDTEELIDNEIKFFAVDEHVWLSEALPSNLISLTPWHAVLDHNRKNVVLDELKKEVSRSHSLFNKLKNLELIFYNQTCDDRLFIDNVTKECFVIHLTWKGSEEIEGFPGYNSYKSLDEWVKTGFFEDYQYFYGLK